MINNANQSVGMRLRWNFTWFILKKSMKIINPSSYLIEELQFGLNINNSLYSRCEEGKRKSGMCMSKFPFPFPHLAPATQATLREPIHLPPTENSLCTQKTWDTYLNRVALPSGHYMVKMAAKCILFQLSFTEQCCFFLYHFSGRVNRDFWIFEFLNKSEGLSVISQGGWNVFEEIR